MVIVLQIEYIDLEFNIKVLLYFASSLPAVGKQRVNGEKDRREGYTTITTLEE